MIVHSFCHIVIFFIIMGTINNMTKTLIVMWAAPSRDGKTQTFGHTRDVIYERRWHLLNWTTVWGSWQIPPRNGQIGETSFWYRIEVETMEERTQQRLQPADEPVPTGREEPLLQPTLWWVARGSVRQLALTSIQWNDLWWIFN